MAKTYSAIKTVSDQIKNATTAASNTAAIVGGNLGDIVDKIQEVDGAKVPTTTTVNGKPLSGNISLDATDIGIAPDLADKVSKTATETIGGTKTFSESPIIPTPDADMEAATKKYVDDTKATVDAALLNKADLVGGKIPTSQLPAYVDDVLEYANLAAFPATGETGKIYVALDTNLTYRWSSTAYVEISKSLALGETSSTAYRGDRGKTAYDHSQTTGNAHGTTAAQIPNTPAGTIAATTVQAAINELDADNVQLETNLNEVETDLNTKTNALKKLFGTNLTTTDITIVAALTGKSVNMDGVISNAYRTNISTPIRVLKGEILFLYADSNGASGICRTDVNGSFYQRINTSEVACPQWFSYSCNKDEYLSVMYYADYANTKCFKMNSTTLSEFKDSIFAEINYPLDKRITNIEGLIDNSFIYSKLITKSYQALNGEINSNGIVTTPSPGYKYTTPIQVFKNDRLNVVDVRGSNIALLSLTDVDGSFYTPIKLSTGSTISFEYIVENDGYIALSFIPTPTTKIEFTDISNADQLFLIIDSMIKQNDAENLGFVSPYKNAPLLSFSQCGENKLYGMEFSLTKNPCSQDGILPICTMISGTSTYQLQYTLAKPTSALNAPQKEWTKADFSSSELSIYFPDFPMAQLINELQLIKDGSLLSKIVLSGKPYRSLVNQNPIITVRYLKKETDVLSGMTDLRLFVNETDGVCNQIIIKKGATIIWQYDIAVGADMYNVYNDMKTQLADTSGYNFDVVFSNIEYATVSDLVPTKIEGLGFVTALTDDALTTGTVVYDTMPVFIETADKTNHKVKIKVGRTITYIEYDGLNVFSFATKCDSLTFLSNDKNIIKVENIDNYYYAPNPMVKIYQAHSLLNTPLPPDAEHPAYPSLHNPIGASQRVSRLLKSKGYESISFKDVVDYLISGKPLPPKSYIIELDDLIMLDGFKKLFSNTDLDGMRMMEMLKQEGLKMSFAMEFSPERTLMEKIENGTATEDEKNKLSAQMTNEQVIKIRAMMRSYDWNIAVHGFIIGCNLTTTTFDTFVSAVRKTIAWHERMFEQSPYSYVVSGTGNSSPYYRRLLTMYGLPIFVQDEYAILNQNLSSCSKLVPYIARIPFYNRSVIDSYGKDIDFD